MQIVRFRGKINIQRPRPPCYEKARLLEATKPRYEPRPYNAVCLQDQMRKKKTKEISPYELIIAREVRNWFDHSKAVAIFHKNPIGSDEFFDARVAFHKQGMALKLYGRSILSQALTNSKFEAILPLFATHSCIVFSPEPKVGQILKISKKIPQLVLLAGIAEDRYLSKNEFTALATMPDLQTSRAQFAATLDSIGGQIVNNLQAHQTQLVTLLDIHANPPKEES